MNRSELFAEVNRGHFIRVGEDMDFRTMVKDGVRYVFFQCTASGTDWINNFKAWVKPYKYMRKVWFAHFGFSHVYNSGRDFLLRAIEGAEPIVAVGYSHGGALATLFHEDVKYTFPSREITTITFGAPRVIWAPFSWNVRRFDGLTRIVRHGDVVAMVPPWWMLYRHVGAVEKIGKASLPSPMMHYPLEYASNV